MNDVHEFYGGAAVFGFMGVAHHFVLAFHYSTGKVSFGVEEPDELIVGTHEGLVIAIDKEVVESDRSNKDEVNYCDLEVDPPVC